MSHQRRSRPVCVTDQPTFQPDRGSSLKCSTVARVTRSAQHQQHRGRGAERLQHGGHPVERSRKGARRAAGGKWQAGVHGGHCETSAHRREGCRAQNAIAHAYHVGRGLLAEGLPGRIGVHGGAAPLAVAHVLVAPVCATSFAVPTSVNQPARSPRWRSAAPCLPPHRCQIVPHVLGFDRSCAHRGSFWFRQPAALASGFASVFALRSRSNSVDRVKLLARQFAVDRQRQHGLGER